MKGRIQWTSWAVVLLSLSFAACTAGLTGSVDGIVARADRSDPVRAAVADLLSVADQYFEPMLGSPLPAAEQERLIDEWTSFRYSTQGQSSMDLLRMAESMAGSSRSVGVSVPGADALYYEQPIVRGNVNAVAHMVELRFPCAFEDRRQVAAGLVARLEPMFVNAPNWNRIDLHDPAKNPVIGTTNFSTYLSMGMNGSSEFLYVTVDYYHDRQNHESMRGVRISVNAQSTRLE